MDNNIGFIGILFITKAIKENKTLNILNIGIIHIIMWYSQQFNTIRRGFFYSRCT